MGTDIDQEEFGEADHRERALAVMLDHYLQCADTGLPVHTWPIAS